MTKIKNLLGLAIGSIVSTVLGVYVCCVAVKVVADEMVSVFKN